MAVWQNNTTVERFMSEIRKLGNDKKYYIGATFSSDENFQPNIPSWKSLHWEGKPVCLRIIKSQPCMDSQLLRIMLKRTENDPRRIQVHPPFTTLQYDGDIVFIAIYDFEYGFPNQRMIKLRDTNELEQCINTMDQNSRYYIGYTREGVRSYLYNTHPKSEKWEGKAHTVGNPVKVRTYYVTLHPGDYTEHTLIKRHRNDPRCLNEAGGQEKSSGIIYLLEYDYFG